MARAANHSITRLSSLIRDPFVATAFRRAEDDGTAPVCAVPNRPPVLSGGFARQLAEVEG